MKSQQKIDPSALMRIESTPGIRVDLAYARADNLLFGERIYRKDASLWLHSDLGRMVQRAAQTLFERGFRMVLYDGLRTVEAQTLMLHTQRVQDNPYWLEPPRLLSTPGAGGHPRGMAVDCSVETLDGVLLDMGTAFDFLATDAGPAVNKAHRAYTHDAEISVNRDVLDDAMIGAAAALRIDLYLMPQEWWDFRLPEDIYDAFAPLSDADLPAEMKMCDQDVI